MNVREGRRPRDDGTISVRAVAAIPGSMLPHQPDFEETWVRVDPRHPKARTGRDRYATDTETGVAPGVTRGRNMRSRCRCSMCPAIHINSRSWLRSSSTHEPSDPPLRVVTNAFLIGPSPMCNMWGTRRNRRDFSLSFDRFQDVHLRVRKWEKLTTS